MSRYNGDYISGSNARNLYDTRQAEINHSPKKRKRGVLKIQNKFKIILSISIIFFLCAACMYRYTMLTELNYKIEKLDKKYTELKNESLRLKVKIESETDLQKIKEAAETKLGMQRPDKNQMIYVKVDMEDFTDTGEKNQKRENNKTLVALTEWLNTLIGKF